MMEEEHYAVFEVCFVDEHADFNYCQNQRIIIPCKDSEVITVQKLKNYLVMYLRGSKKSEKILRSDVAMQSFVMIMTSN